MRITVELDVYDIARASAEHMAAFAQAAKSIADGRVKEESEMREQYAQCLTGHGEKAIEPEEKAAKHADEEKAAKHADEEKAAEPADEEKAAKTNKKQALKKVPKKQGKPAEEPKKPTEEHKEESVKPEPEEAKEPVEESEDKPKTEEPESGVLKDKPVEKPAEEPAEKAVTLEELQDLCKQRAKANKDLVPKLKEIMNKFGIEKLHEIKEEDIPVFYKEAEALK